MKTIEVKINVGKSNWQESPNYSLYIMGEAEELGNWQYAIKMDDLCELYPAIEERGETRIGFRYSGSDNILNTQFKLFFGRNFCDRKIEANLLAKLFPEKGNKIRTVNSEPDHGYNYNDEQCGAINSDRIELSVFDFIDTQPMTLQEFVIRKCAGNRELLHSLLSAEDFIMLPTEASSQRSYTRSSSSFFTVDLQDSFFTSDETIVAFINTEYGNAIFISGSHRLFKQNSVAFRLDNIDANSWAISLPPETKDCHYTFYLGKWEHGPATQITNLERLEWNPHTQRLTRRVNTEIAASDQVDDSITNSTHHLTM